MDACFFKLSLPFHRVVGSYHLYADLPLEVVSTGLRYLIVPIQHGLERAHIVSPTFERLLAQVGVQFAYVLDIPTREGRHWNNDGLLEDVATGSAAGTVGAYLAKHAHIQPGQEFLLHQRRFTGRPSQMRIRVERHDVSTLRQGHETRSGSLVSVPFFRTGKPWYCAPLD